MMARDGEEEIFVIDGELWISQTKELGVTKPISWSGPTKNYETKTQELEKYLADYWIVRKPGRSCCQGRGFGNLDQIVKSWVKRVSRAKGFNEQFVKESNAKIFTFVLTDSGCPTSDAGDFGVTSEILHGLNKGIRYLSREIMITKNQSQVHGPGADIDTLCVGPRHATREEDFFTELHCMLSEMPEVTELHPVPDAHVPVMKFKFSGVSIDFLYAKLSLCVIPEILNNLILFDPEFSYNLALHEVLGKAPWSLLECFRVPRWYKLGIPSMLVSRFFWVYTQWRGPNPVMLCEIQEGNLRLPIWDPRRNSRDRFHQMPIITPVYPCMNSSYNVSSSTLRVMTEEFQHGNGICKAMEANKADWDTLFESYPFFEAYKHYLEIDISAENESDLRKWKGWVELDFGL
ncbi:Poly(A) polymerase predicted RNA binding domain [Musa troglodytarum]|uniref:polynucleotide adenylyltransferase n=1 Tax=Musa troglodytarum TaxID=320322 RepID=A0A9E7K930_9LILI|nr:Poly(A) polymerase predicted RNA binding domain [Musa troglodytarum]